MSMVKMEDLDKVRRQKDMATTLGQIKTKYLIMSGKGGVGKTTVAVNLAASLAARGDRVGLLDIDLHGPSVAVALGVTMGNLELGPDGKLIPMVSEFGLKVVTIQGLLHAQDEAIIWRGPKKIRAINQFLSEVRWGELDYLVIDSPPGTGDELLTILELVGDIRPVVVTSGSKLSVSDAAKSFNFMKLMGKKAFGLIDNQSWQICPKCGETTDIYDRQAAEGLASLNHTPFLGSLPLNLDVVRASEEGRPIIWSNPNHSFSMAFNGLAEVLK